VETYFVVAPFAVASFAVSSFVVAVVVAFQAEASLVLTQHLEKALSDPRIVREGSLEPVASGAEAFE
jgi:hypothetical protein